MKTDPMQRPVSPELEMLIPVLAETMKFATQALRQSIALADALIAKGVVTKAELDEHVKSTEGRAKNLLDLLDESIRKMM